MLETRKAAAIGIGTAIGVAALAGIVSGFSSKEDENESKDNEKKKLKGPETKILKEDENESKDNEMANTELIAVTNKKINNKIFESKIVIQFDPINLTNNQKTSLIDGMTNATDQPGDDASRTFADAVHQIGTANPNIYPEEAAKRVIEIDDGIRTIIDALKSNFQAVQRHILDAAGLLPTVAQPTNEIDAALEAIAENWNDFSSEEKVKIVTKSMVPFHYSGLNIFVVRNATFLQLSRPGQTLKKLEDLKLIKDQPVSIVTQYRMLL